MRLLQESNRYAEYSTMQINGQEKHFSKTALLDGKKWHYEQSKRYIVGNYAAVEKSLPHRSIAQKAIVDQFIEAATDKKNSQNPLVSKLSYLKDVLFSAETTRRARELQDVIDGFDSSHNILFKI